MDVLCNLYYIYDEEPYSMQLEWEKPWKAFSNSTATLTVFTKFSVFEQWREIYSITGGNSSKHANFAESSRMVRVRVHNPAFDHLSFIINVKPTHGNPINLTTGQMILISFGILAGCGLIFAIGYFIYKKRQSPTQPPPSSSTNQ